MQNDSAEKILQDFEKVKWDANPLVRIIALSNSHPEEIEKLLRTAITNGYASFTFLQDAISYLEPQAFPSLVSESLEILSYDPNNRLVEDFIGHASLQFPTILHPYLTRIFEITSKDRYFGNWAWRESGNLHFDFLSSVIADPLQQNSWFKAWCCLLEIRTEKAFQLALNKTATINLRHDPLLMLQEVGYEYQQGTFCQLYPAKISHMLFESGYLENIPEPDWLQLIHHPTWRLPRIGEKFQFGGLSQGNCNICGGTLHHIITFSPVPSEIGISGLERLELATCLSCLGWEKDAFILWYKHEADGSPKAIGYNGPQIEPQFPTEGLKPTVVQLALTPNRWYWQDWGASTNSRQNLHRVGGFPTWVQSAQYPKCPLCNNIMSFIMQLDSDLPTVDNGEWLWGSGGICYIFWCDSCKVSGFLWQCT